MSNYSDDPAMVRIDFWKSSGKWYTTEAMKWLGYDGYIWKEFVESLQAHLGDRLSEMDVTCLDPYNKNSFPLQIKSGGWNKKTKVKEAKCNHDNFREERIMDFSFLICNDCGYQWKA